MQEGVSSTGQGERSSTRPVRHFVSPCSWWLPQQGHLHLADKGSRRFCLQWAGSRPPSWGMGGKEKVGELTWKELQGQEIFLPSTWVLWVSILSFEIIIIPIIPNSMLLGGGRWNSVKNTKLLFTMSFKGYLFFLLKQKSWVGNVSSDCLCSFILCSAFFFLIFCTMNIFYFLMNSPPQRRTLKFIIKILPRDIST